MIIVVDAAAWGSSDPVVHMETLRRWVATAERADAEIVIPEPCLWELFHHYLKGEERFLTALAAYTKLRDRHDLPSPTRCTQMTISDLISRVEETGAKVLRVSGEVALEALKDQILQKGAGSTKKGVKVGASDSAWLRAVHAHAGGTFDGVCVLTGDMGAIQGIASELDVRPPQVIRTFTNLGQVLKCEPVGSEECEEWREIIERDVSLYEEAITHALLPLLHDPPMRPFDTDVVIHGVALQESPPLVQYSGDSSVTGEIEISGDLRLLFDDSQWSGIPWDQWEDRISFRLLASVVVNPSPSGGSNAHINLFDVLSVGQFG